MTIYVLLSYWSSTYAKCVPCTSPFSNIYAISGGSTYNPYMCYIFPNIGSDWDGTHNYCDSIGGSMLYSNTAYYNISWNYFARGWCAWTVYTWNCWIYWSNINYYSCCGSGCRCYEVCQSGN